MEECKVIGGVVRECEDGQGQRRKQGLTHIGEMRAPPLTSQSTLAQPALPPLGQQCQHVQGAVGSTKRGAPEV